MRDEVAFLALGIALGNTRLLPAVLDVPGAVFATRPLRLLFEALGKDRDAVRLALIAFGVEMPDGTTAAEAVIGAVRRRGEWLAQDSLAWRIGEASRKMPPEQFREYALRQLGAVEPVQEQVPQLKIAE